MATETFGRIEPRAPTLPMRLFATSDRAAPVFARVALAVVMWPHGAQKVLALFGGHGFTASVAGLHRMLGVPTWLAVVEVLTEFLAPVALLLGFCSRIAALGIGVIMVVAILSVHAHFGFFMNWTGDKPGEGFEYHVLMMGLVLVVLLDGAGALSIDRRIARG